MANMMKQGYSIDWQTNTITMTKKFAEEANQYGSDAYNLLMDVKSKGFHITVRQSKPRKACPTRVTFKQMEITLSCMDHPDERLAELHAIMDAGKGQKNQYEYVRQWFLLNYPHYREIPVVDSNYRIVAPRLHVLPEAADKLEAVS